MTPTLGGAARASRLLVQLAACASLTLLSSCADAQTTPPTLFVTLDLPDEAEVTAGLITARVVVTGPSGERRESAASRLYADLEPGTYFVEAHDLEIAGRRYLAQPPVTRLQLAPGDFVTVPVTYVDAEARRQFYPPEAVVLQPGAATYHVDCLDGNDGFAGLRHDRAVRSVARAQELPLRPGDRLLLRRGCVWPGPLVVNWQGSADAPVTIGAYGEGPAPLIFGARQNNVDVHGAHIVIEHLSAASDPTELPLDAACRDQPVAWRTGFTVQHEAHDVTLRYVSASGNTAGVHLTRGARGVQVLHSHLVDNVVMSVNTDDGGFDDSGAWGLLINGSDNVIAYNLFSGNNAWCSYDFGQEGASIEIYEGVNNLIHHNLSVDDTTFSEIGSSSTRAARDNVFAYNVYTSTLPVSQFLVIRGDDAHFGPTHGTGVYHNTVYLMHQDETQGIVCYAGCGPELLDARNNVIWVEWKALYADAPFTESHNLYWNSRGRPLLQFMSEGSAIDPTSLVADPLFHAAAIGDLRLAANSPAAGSGVSIDLELELGVAVEFTFDASGASLAPDGPRDIGAFSSVPSEE